MKVVVDTNILFSFFRENPVRSMIINAQFYSLRLFTPDYALQELEANKKDLMKYTKLKDDGDIEIIFQAIKEYIETKPSTFFQECKDEAKALSPDQKDAPFFALALKLKADIWSNEPRLKRQEKVKVLNTQDIRKILNC